MRRAAFIRVCLTLAGAAAVPACARRADNAAARFVGVISLDASNQTGPRSQLMMQVDEQNANLRVRFVYGPGGQPRSVRVDGDSLVIVWAVRPGVRDYRFVIRPTHGDSVAGTWEGGEGHGTLSGRHSAA